MQVLIAAAIVVVTAFVSVVQHYEGELESRDAEIVEVREEKQKRLESLLRLEEDVSLLVETLTVVESELETAQKQREEAVRLLEAEAVRHAQMTEFIQRLQPNLGRDYAEGFAAATIRAGDEYNISPRILVGVARKESSLGTHRSGRLYFRNGRLQATTMGDQGRSCGAFQIRHDIRNRPSCEELFDVENAAVWAAGELRRLIGVVGPRNYLAAYNAGQSRPHISPAQKYQRDVERFARR